MDLVDKQQGASTVVVALLFRLCGDLPNLLDTLEDSTESGEFAAGGVGDNSGERGLAGAGRSPEDR